MALHKIQLNFVNFLWPHTFPLLILSLIIEARLEPTPLKYSNQLRTHNKGK